MDELNYWNCHHHSSSRAFFRGLWKCQVSCLQHCRLPYSRLVSGLGSCLLASWPLAARRNDRRRQRQRRRVSHGIWLNSHTYKDVCRLRGAPSEFPRDYGLSDYLWTMDYGLWTMECGSLRVLMLVLVFPHPNSSELSMVISASAGPSSACSSVVSPRSSCCMDHESMDHESTMDHEKFGELAVGDEVPSSCIHDPSWNVDS